MWIHFKSSRFYRHLRVFNAVRRNLHAPLSHEIISVSQTYVKHHSRFEKKTHMSNDNPELRDSEVFLISPDMSIINLNSDEGTSIAEVKNECFAKEVPPFRNLSSFGCAHPDHTILLELVHGDKLSLELFVGVEDMQHRPSYTISSHKGIPTP